MTITEITNVNQLDKEKVYFAYRSPTAESAAGEFFARWNVVAEALIMYRQPGAAWPMFYIVAPADLRRRK